MRQAREIVAKILMLLSTAHYALAEWVAPWIKREPRR